MHSKCWLKNALKISQNKFCSLEWLTICSKHWAVRFQAFFHLLFFFNGIFILTGVNNPSAAKAEIADALKFCCREPQFGERISAILQRSNIWAQYKDQRHDLFLPTLTQTQAITGKFIQRKIFIIKIKILFLGGPSGGSASIAGYLTEGMFEPPPARLAPPPAPPCNKDGQQKFDEEFGPLGPL